VKTFTVHRFRDYWSNRQSYGKNKFAETEALDFPDKHDVVSSELVTHNKGETVDVTTVDGKLVASGLINPFLLMQKRSLREARKALFSHLERWLPSIAIVFIVLNFGFSVVFHLQANIYEISSFLPIDRERNLILMALSNRISLAALLNGSLWLALLTGWLSRIVKEVITFGACAVAANVLILILFIYLGEVPTDAGNYSDKPAAIALLIIIGAFVGWGFIYWLRHQAHTPRTLVGHMVIDAHFRMIIPIVPVFLFAIVGYIILPDGDYPSLIRNLGILASSGMIGLLLLMHPHPSLELYNLTCYLYDNMHKELFPFQKTVGDSPSWINGQYWVFRHIYVWKWEFTLPKPVRDFERIELWCDAKTGKLEWIVTDFHFRELWHRVKGDFEEIVVDWDENFHTFDIDIEAELQEIARKIGEMESRKGLVSLNKTVRLYNEYLKKRKAARKGFLTIHPPEAVLPYLKDCSLMAKAVAKEFSGRPWSYWRYAFGAYSRSDINLWSRYAACGLDYPASAHQFAKS